MTLPKVISEQTVCDIPAESDVRGPFGYGRPAHGSDPHAVYGFFPPGGPVHGQSTDAAEVVADRREPEGAQRGDDLRSDKAAAPNVRFGIRDIRYL